MIKIHKKELRLELMLKFVNKKILEMIQIQLYNFNSNNHDSILIYVPIFKKTKAPTLVGIFIKILVL